MANLFISKYIRTLLSGERQVADSFLSETGVNPVLGLNNVRNLPSMFSSPLIKVEKDQFVHGSTIESNHGRIVDSITRYYDAAQKISELQTATDFLFSTSLSNVESSLDQLRMELEAWDKQMNNRANFSNSISKSFMPDGLSSRSSGRDEIAIKGHAYRTNAPILFDENDYRFTSSFNSTINSNLFSSLYGLQVELTIEVEPNQSNSIKFSPWTVTGAPATLLSLNGFCNSGDPVVIAENLVLDKEYFLTFPKSNISRFVFKIIQQNYSLIDTDTSPVYAYNPPPTTTAVQQDKGQIHSPNIGTAWWNIKAQEDWTTYWNWLRYAYYDYIYAVPSNPLANINPTGVPDQVIPIEIQEFRYQCGVQGIQIFNNYISDDSYVEVINLKLEDCPTYITLRASDWIPENTAVEYSIRAAGSNEWTPLPNADEDEYVNEILHPDYRGICQLRFPFQTVNGNMPEVYEGSKKLEPGEYYFFNERVLQLRSTLTGQSPFLIKYEVADKENIKIPYAESLSVYKDSNGELGDTFSGTSSEDKVILSEKPFVDTERLSTDGYSPVTVLIPGRTTTDLTDWSNGKETEFNRVPDLDNIYYKVRGKSIYFDQPVDLPITVIYEYLKSMVELKIAIRTLNTPADSPVIYNVQLSYLGRM